MSDLMALPSVLPMAQCIPTNDLLYGPLGPIITKLAGGFGGLILPTAVMVLLLGAVGFVVTVLTKKASMFLRAIGVVVGVILGLPLLILIVSAVYTLLNNACSVNLL
jgi:hypothetical protein